VAVTCGLWGGTGDRRRRGAMARGPLAAQGPLQHFRLLVCRVRPAILDSGPWLRATGAHCLFKDNVGR